MTGAGDQVPAEAVSVEPTFAAPEIFGVGDAVSFNSGTTAVAADLRTVVVYSRFIPVTCTLSAEPASAMVTG